MATNESVVADPEDETFAGTEIDDPFFDDPIPVVKAPVAPDMNPAHIKWNPKKYFAAQPKDIIVVKRNESDVLSDPTGHLIMEIPVSINGYTIKVKKGVPTRVPRDFALMLVDIGAAYRYADIPEAVE